MKAYTESKTRKEDRDKRATPPELVELLEVTLGVQFIWDVCAEDHTSVSPYYWTEEDDALTKEWGQKYLEVIESWIEFLYRMPAMWENPPYSNPLEWCKKAAEESGNGAIIVGLLPDDRSTEWYQEYIKKQATTVYVTDRRLPFLDANGVPQFGNPKGSVIPIWTPWKTHQAHEEIIHIPDELIKVWRGQVNEAKRKAQ